ncbi:MAG: helix-turn-helix domain-containing protein [Nanoarchaeota archaeon]|nr:helix-turn-helix domain-containing protein [Nanoarchaeota archaeon]MBU1622002.1 helix-turn-helix domain-containing protein [Nanoarchaeota archaeon]MBU1974363.1 helix-turn-helix domain-containing protein [Nanoarchaeota archaeon]
MWIAVFEGTHQTCLLAPLCKKYQITDFVYLVNAWEEQDSFYYSEAHLLQGNEEDKKKFIAALKKEESMIKFEQKGNFIITLEKKPKWMVAYMPLWDKRIIQTKPVVQKTDGTEHWEMACWDKEPLMQILERLPKEFKIKLKSIKKSKIDEIFLPHIMPKLSDKQKEVIQLAVKRGYYNFPRKINLNGLAKELKLSKPTLQQHLRIAEKKVVPFLTENII